MCVRRAPLEILLIGAGRQTCTGKDLLKCVARVQGMTQTEGLARERLCGNIALLVVVVVVVVVTVSYIESQKEAIYNNGALCSVVCVSNLFDIDEFICCLKLKKACSVVVVVCVHYLCTESYIKA